MGGLARLGEISLDFAMIQPRRDENFLYEHAEVGQPVKGMVSKWDQDPETRQRGDPGTRESGPLSKFKSGTPGLSSKFKSGTPGSPTKFKSETPSSFFNEFIFFRIFLRFFTSIFSCLF